MMTETQKKCECGAPAIETERRWQVRLDDDGDPETYGRGQDIPVCYGMGPRRFDAADYGEHVLRLAEAQGSDPETIAIIRAKIARAPIATSLHP